MLFDTHAHLIFDRKTDDPEGDIARAREAGVSRIAAAGIDLPSSKAAAALASEHEDVFAIAGIHPHEADRSREEDLAGLARLLPSARVVAVGETGLDYHRDYAGRDNQKKLFKGHLELAARFEMPLVLHVREAHSDALAILGESFPSGWKGIAHCFSGTPAEAAKYLDLGFLISLAGPVTYPGASNLRELARDLPLEKLLLETDCPFLAPQAMRGKRNEPAYLVHTARKVAELRGIELEELALATTANALRVFCTEE